ncbi:hypothetical protein [Abditibacterium utsteinense]|uniref:hypothetical protein n=1 Tax=Abditibacterium utsteinense TaxID=1960156 RepID=UPI000F49EE9C|nr:hypothetical protein [Abditibacterium utsteinense]
MVLEPAKAPAIRRVADFEIETNFTTVKAKFFHLVANSANLEEIPQKMKGIYLEKLRLPFIFCGFRPHFKTRNCGCSNCGCSRQTKAPAIAHDLKVTLAVRRDAKFVW